MHRQRGCQWRSNRKLQVSLHFTLELVMHSDPQTTTLKETRISLEKEFPGRPELISPQMRMLIIEEIRSELRKRMDVNSESLEILQEQSDHQLALQLAREERMATKRPKRSTGIHGSITSKKKAAPIKKKRTGVSNFPVLHASPKLSICLGGRTEVTSAEAIKLIWVHIKEADLQDPRDRRYILADEKLGGIFGNHRRVHMFHLGRFVQQHLFKTKQVYLE